MLFTLFSLSLNHSYVVHTILSLSLSLSLNNSYVIHIVLSLNHSYVVHTILSLYHNYVVHTTLSLALSQSQLCCSHYSLSITAMLFTLFSLLLSQSQLCYSHYSLSLSITAMLFTLFSLSLNHSYVIPPILSLALSQSQLCDSPYSLSCSLSITAVWFTFVFPSLTCSCVHTKLNCQQQQLCLKKTEGWQSSEQFSNLLSITSCQPDRVTSGRMVEQVTPQNRSNAPSWHAPDWSWEFSTKECRQACPDSDWLGVPPSHASWPLAATVKLSGCWWWIRNAQSSAGSPAPALSLAAVSLPAPQWHWCSGSSHHAARSGWVPGYWLWAPCCWCVPWHFRFLPADQHQQLPYHSHVYTRPAHGR